jgi:hypothetical protein
MSVLIQTTRGEAQLARVAVLSKARRQIWLVKGHRCLLRLGFAPLNTVDEHIDAMSQSQLYSKIVDS